jgi:polyene glycosyltransferase
MDRTAEVEVTNETREPILFVSASGYGVLNAMLTVAGELARHGTPNVWFATDENRRADVEALNEGSGVQFASLGEPVAFATLAEWPENEYLQATQRSRWKAHRAVVRFELQRGIEKFADIAAVVDRVRPAVMVIDASNLLAIAIAITKGVPYILSSVFMPSNQLFHLAPRDFPFLHTGLPRDMTLLQRLYNQVFKVRSLLMFMHPRMWRVLRQVRANRARYGLSPLAGNPRSKTDRAELVLCYTVFGLEYPFDVPSKVHTLGAIIPPLPQAPGEGEISGWLDRHDSVVYMGFGTLWRPSEADVRGLVEVARRLGQRHQVLWKLPKGHQHLLPADLPANLRVESSLPSQLDVLAHRNVKMFFNHGGANAFHEALYFGKPMVVRPLWVDCYDQAVRAVDSGVGLTVDRPDIVDVEDTVAKLDKVLNEPRFTCRAEHFAGEMRRAGGVHAAADLILNCPALGRPVAAETSGQ